MNSRQLKQTDARINGGVSLAERLIASGMTPAQAQLFEDMPSRRVTIEPRRPFREPGVARDEVMFVRSGILSKYKTDGSGRRQIVALRFAGDGILPRDGTAALKVAARLKLSKKARQRLAASASPDLDLNPQALAFRQGATVAQDRLLLADRPADAAALSHWPIPTLPLGGGELVRRGVPQGPDVARLLREIEQKWVAAGFPSGDPLDAIVSDVLA